MSNLMMINKRNSKPISEDKDQSSLNREETIFDLIDRLEIIKIREIINNPKKKFWEFIDHEGSTILIKLAYCNNEMVFEVIDSAKKNLNMNQLTLYVNKKAFNGFTALHYSSFKGNVKLCEKLIENYADINVVNNNGLNLLHMSAQGDQPSTLILFKEKYKLNPQKNDNVLSGPVHWAAYMGSDITLDFLANWNLSLENNDKDGFTPLHLAVMTDRIKIAKKLLKLGVDPEKTDNKNRKPIDIAIQKNFKSMEELLNNETNYVRCVYNIKQARRKHFYPFFFVGYFLIKEFFTIFTISYYVDSHKLILISILSLIVLFILNFTLLFHIPEIEKGKIEKPLLSLVLSGESLKNYCPFCKINKSTSTYHCYYCKTCIEKYDHHCIWLNNCIGKSNIFTFRVFLIWIIFKILINLTMSFKSFYTNIIIENSFIKSIYPLLGIFTNRKFKQLISSLDVITGVIVLIPVLILLYDNTNARGVKFPLNKYKTKNKLISDNSDQESEILIKI